MSGFVVDTHALIWLLFSPDRLSPKARVELDGALNQGRSVVVPTICLIEIAYLIERKRLEESVWTRVLEVVTDQGRGVVLLPLDVRVAECLRRVSADEIPEMPDRIIAATALLLDLPLITHDRCITASAIRTIW